MSCGKNINIRNMKAEDWNAVASIYKQGIATGFATFETDVPDFETWDSAHLKTCRIVAVQGDELVGWAALSPVSGRCVYGGVGEVSVYIAANTRSLGVGTLLLQQLILESEKEGLWTLQSGIFPENEGSIQLHKKMGFRYIGKREKIGRTVAGIWSDNVLFERRSSVIGTN